MASFFIVECMHINRLRTDLMSTGDFDFNNNGEKTYIDGFSLRIIDGLHHIAFQSGSESWVFVTPLPGSKGLSRGLGKQVEEFEKANNVIVPSHLSDEPLESPLKREDLGQNGGQIPPEEKK